MNIKIAALIGAAGAILAANSAAASEIVNDQGIFGSVQIAHFSPLGQSFVAVDPWLKSIGFSYLVFNPELSDSLQIDLYDGVGAGGDLIASRSFKPTKNGFFDTDFTGTGLTVGSSYTAAVRATTSEYFAVITGNNYDGGQISSPRDVGPALGVSTSSVDLAFRIVGTTVSPVPEPATWALMLAGFGLVGAGLRRRTPVVRCAVTFG